MFKKRYEELKARISGVDARLDLFYHKNVDIGNIIETHGNDIYDNKVSIKELDLRILELEKKIENIETQDNESNGLTNDAVEFINKLISRLAVVEKKLENQGADKHFKECNCRQEVEIDSITNCLNPALADIKDIEIKVSELKERVDKRRDEHVEFSTSIVKKLDRIKHDISELQDYCNDLNDMIMNHVNNSDAGKASETKLRLDINHDNRISFYTIDTREYTLAEAAMLKAFPDHKVFNPKYCVKTIQKKLRKLGYRGITGQAILLGYQRTIGYLGYEIKLDGGYLTFKKVK